MAAAMDPQFGSAANQAKDCSSPVQSPASESTHPMEAGGKSIGP